MHAPGGPGASVTLQWLTLRAPPCPAGGDARPRANHPRAGGARAAADDGRPLSGGLAARRGGAAGGGGRLARGAAHRVHRNAGNGCNSCNSCNSCNGWREELLIEYIATQEGVKQDRFGHILDSGNATFRGLRRIARGQDLAYFEFTDPYADWAFERLAYFELYNLSADPEQLVNAYATASVATRQELSQRLRAMYACVGSGCA